MQDGDISTLTRLGPDVRDFISLFLVNTCLSGVRPETDNPHRRRTVNTCLYGFEKNTQLVIEEGLAGMEDSDFNCWRNKNDVKVEDGVSFNWAYKARLKIPNAYLQFQERAENGRVDFYLNGLADTAIEVTLDATQTVDPTKKGNSQDIDAHLKRFEDGDYPWQRFVLFNFAMSKDKVLPRNTSVHDKVYTFVRSTNALYCGDKFIKSPAIPKLSGGSRFFGGKKKAEKKKEEKKKGKKKK